MDIKIQESNLSEFIKFFTKVFGIPLEDSSRNAIDRWIKNGEKAEIKGKVEEIKEDIYYQFKKIIEPDVDTVRNDIFNHWKLVISKFIDMKIDVFWNAKDIVLDEDKSINDYLFNQYTECFYLLLKVLEITLNKINSKVIIFPDFIYDFSIDESPVLKVLNKEKEFFQTDLNKRLAYGTFDLDRWNSLGDVNISVNQIIDLVTKAYEDEKDKYIEYKIFLYLARAFNVFYSKIIKDFKEYKDTIITMSDSYLFFGNITKERMIKYCLGQFDLSSPILEIILECNSMSDLIQKIKSIDYGIIEERFKEKEKQYRLETTTNLREFCENLITYSTDVNKQNIIDFNLKLQQIFSNELEEYNAFSLNKPQISSREIVLNKLNKAFPNLENKSENMLNKLIDNRISNDSKKIEIFDFIDFMMKKYT